MSGGPWCVKGQEIVGGVNKFNKASHLVMLNRNLSYAGNVKVSFSRCFTYLFMAPQRVTMALSLSDRHPMARLKMEEERAGA